MEIFSAGVGILQTILNVIGGGMVIIGILMFLGAQGDNGGNPAGKQQGISLMVAGGGICLVANTLVPMLANMG